MIGYVRRANGNYLLVTDSLSLEMDRLSGSILRVLPSATLPMNDLSRVKPAKVYSCLVDVANKSARASLFKGSSVVSKKPVKVSKLIKKQQDWLNDNNFLFDVLIEFNVSGASFKQLLYVLEV